MSFVFSGLEFLSTFYFNLVFLFGFLGFLALNCGVCDSSSPIDFQDSYGYDNHDAQSPSDSVGFDINPAMSPVFEKGATESNFDMNVFEEHKEESSWWNVRILCGGGSSTSAL
ncbi:hypothetical protein CRE_29982 [Caenorhabditis remanei]|uniref:Uncharacterized protein n=1 Tax=Caenorhabditis remanei TaxID=31234 RepID=E3MM07_CAERE|nr:hypothetical protein CRE_29982 [Caenorhabditis remanei]